jgi:hypothetical protein
MQKFGVRPGAPKRCHAPPGTKPGPSDDTEIRISAAATDCNAPTPEPKNVDAAARFGGLSP